MAGEYLYVGVIGISGKYGGLCGENKLAYSRVPHLGEVLRNRKGLQRAMRKSHSHDAQEQ